MRILGRTSHDIVRRVVICTTATHHARLHTSYVGYLDIISCHASGKCVYVYMDNLYL